MVRHAHLRRLGLTSLSLGICLGALAVPSVAHAQRELLSPLGARGTLAIDQLSGFRASTIGGVSYAGPIGFSIQTFGENALVGQGKQTIHYTNFWLAPSADYFVIDHLSIGGLIEVVATSSSVDVQANPNAATQSFSLPSTTNFTFLPRVGWMFPLSDRFGIWPRAGIGYASRQSASANNNFANTSKDTYSSLIFDIDVGFLYRVNENWFLRAAPEITFGVGGTHSVSGDFGNGTATTSASASLFQFAGVAGIGVLWDL
jgi:hypothetical protein